MWVILFQYFVAFTFGYILSVVFHKSIAGLFTVGNALLWSFLFGGVSPDLADVNDPKGIYGSVAWLWNLSAPRWGIEAFYIKEAGARQWAELSNLSVPLTHTYDRNNFSSDIQNTFTIGVFWAVFAFLTLKLTKRRNQK